MNKLIVLIILMTSSCKIHDIKSTIQIKNNTDQAISIFLALPTHVGFAYPDTILPENEIVMKVARPEQSNYYHFGFTIDELFDFLPSDTLSIYYFSTDTLNKYTWEEIREHNMVLRRDDLTLPMNEEEWTFWLIEYP